MNQDELQQNNYMVNDLAEKQEQFFAGNVIDWKRSGDTFIFRCDNDTSLKVYFLSDEVLRFRFSTNSYFPDDFSYAVTETSFKAPEISSVEEKNGWILITTQKLIVAICLEKLKSRIMNLSGEVLNEDEKGFHWEESRETGNDIVMMSKMIQSSEHFYGLGDKSCSLDLRSKRFELWGADTYGYGKKSDPLYKNIPFYYGLHKKKAYGIFLDNTFRTFFDFGFERSNVASYFAHGGEMNYYFFYGPELIDVAKKYTHLTGTPEMPPLWALGYHQCKWSYYPESKVNEITDGFRERQIPCDAIYLDIDYMDGFRCFTWNKDYFPDPAKMVKRLAKNGFKTIVIIDPGIKIDKNYSVYKEGFEKGYFCKRADGPLMKGSVWPGLCNFPDYTHPDVREWWSNLFEGLIADVGVRGVWNDMNEPAVFEEGTFPSDVRHDFDGHPCSHLKAHNVYGMQMSRATYDGVKKFSYPDRPFTITRSGYAGMQRYASVWTGDNVASWEHLTIANIQCQRLSVSGVSFAGTDIGGFIESPSGELYVRWIQLGIFHPFCRTHSSGDHGEQEPWSFGDKYTKLVRKFIELRYQLLPYLYTVFREYVVEGTPMLQPLAFMGQCDVETYYRQDEFGLGEKILVCPVSVAEAKGRWLYLPAGKWYYFWTDEIYPGEQEIWGNAELDRIPFYIKAGTVLPFAPVMQYVGEKKIEALQLHLYYTKGENESELYEDKGDGYDYEQNNQYCVKSFTLKGAEKETILQQNKEGHYKAEYADYELVFHGFPEKVSSVKVDGKKYDQLNTVSFYEQELQSVIVPADFKELVIQ